MSDPAATVLAMTPTRLCERACERTSVTERVTAIVVELPEATATGTPHLTLAVRRKTFGEVRELLTEAYRLQAPKKLAALLDQSQAGSSSPR
jgi:hypothetical protein